MKEAFRPEGYPQLSPYLMVAGSARLLEFLTQAFDAVPLRRFDAADGSIMHVELKIGDSVVMFAEGGDSFPAFPAWIHFYVPDASQSYQRALAAGGIAVQEPVQKEGDPDLRGGVRDPSGNVWWISTQVG